MTGTHTTGTEALSWPSHLWPASDRLAWEAACRAGERLKRGGAAGHFRPVTQHDLAKRYGTFIAFLSRSGRLTGNARAGVHVSPDNIEAYISDLKGRVSTVTVYGSIQKLRRMTQLIAPERELGWLIEIERDLAFGMRPRSKWDRIVYTDVLLEAGLTLMAEAEAASHLTRLAQARMFRNGLMVALLACCPIRLKNFTSLEIGRSFVNDSGTWWIMLSASETKEKRPDQREVLDLLTQWINRYIETYRPTLARSYDASNALWLSSENGWAMSAATVHEVISDTTESTIGVRVSPHLFRTAAATTVAVHAGDNPHLGSALLHHRHPAVTEANYNRASCLRAAQDLASINRPHRRSQSWGS